MNDKAQNNRGEAMIQHALGAYLQARNTLVNVDPDSRHLDEDVLTAFVEGNLSERESKPVVSHMADCSYCLHVSAELIKLDLAFAEESGIADIPATAPASVGEVLGGIMKRIFGSNDGAVFAHEEKSEEEESESADNEE